MTAPDAPRRRGPIGRLDLDTIVTAGLRLASTPGVASITVRELGRELKADPSAIYKHVGNKEDLMKALLDRLTGMIIDATADTAGWREYLMENAMATLDLYLAHPCVGAEAMSLSSGGPNELALVDRILRALGDAGLDAARAARYYAVYSAFVISFSAGLAASETRRETDDVIDRWMDAPDTVDAEALPHIAASRDFLAELTGLQAYHEGLTVILDAAESEARTRET